MKRSFMGLGKSSEDNSRRHLLLTVQSLILIKVTAAVTAGRSQSDLPPQVWPRSWWRCSSGRPPATGWRWTGSRWGECLFEEIEPAVWESVWRGLQKKKKSSSISLVSKSHKNVCQPLFDAHRWISNCTSLHVTGKRSDLSHRFTLELYCEYQTKDLKHET